MTLSFSKWLHSHEHVQKMDVTLATAVKQTDVKMIRDRKNWIFFEWLLSNLPSCHQGKCLSTDSFSIGYLGWVVFLAKEIYI